MGIHGNTMLPISTRSKLMLLFVFRKAKKQRKLSNSLHTYGLKTVFFIGKVSRNWREEKKDDYQETFQGKLLNALSPCTRLFTYTRIYFFS